ncbi:MAG: bifunctional phosphoribosyl-AMP cyclohydrolase/phosphoribosyl-ATP diphosphatase HisIE [Peptococcaceae bacterium]
MGNVDLKKIKWNHDNLVPAVLQDYLTGKVLMLGYMNEEAVTKTLETGEVWFWSRSRRTLWHKGETSGNIQKLVNITPDCDYDTLLVMVEPQGPTCHLGTESCFARGSNLLTDELIATITARYQERPENSYTSYLFNQGLDKILKKVGEEAAEVIIAAKNEGNLELAQESADLLYHLLVLFQERDINIKDILGVLRERRSKS